MEEEEIEDEELKMLKPSGFTKNGILIWIIVLILIVLFFLG